MAIILLNNFIQVKSYVKFKVMVSDQKYGADILLALHETHKNLIKEGSV